MIKKMICGVYCIKNKKSNKRYSGSSVDIKGRRWPKHKSQLKNGNHINNYLQSAWDKYGEENFVFEIIQEIVDENNLRRVEGRWSKTYKTTDRRYGYNLCEVDEKGQVRLSEETKKKISKSHEGKTLSAIHKKRISVKVSGENNPRSKISWEMVNLVRRDHLSGKYTAKQLALKHKISLRATQHVISEGWNDVNYAPVSRTEILKQKSQVLLKASKHTRKEIAKIIGVSEGIIEKWISEWKQEGIVYSLRRETFKKKALKLLAKNKTVKEVARITGLNQASIYNYIKELKRAER